MDSRSSGGSGGVRFGSLSQKPSLGPQKRGTMAAAALDTSPAAGGVRR